jgi:hypothetical protein
VAEATVDDLPSEFERARQSADTFASIVRLIASTLTLAKRDPTAAIDVKAEAMAAGFTAERLLARRSRSTAIALPLSSAYRSRSAFASSVRPSASAVARALSLVQG